MIHFDYHYKVVIKYCNHRCNVVMNNIYYDMNEIDILYWYCFDTIIYTPFIINYDFFSILLIMNCFYKGYTFLLVSTIYDAYFSRGTLHTYDIKILVSNMSCACIMYNV